jgi:D-alanyl-lipoteichoic acid acyltransferase DltB (MBOAT superfamily)
MLFNSYFFILVYFPVTLGIYFALNRRKLTVASRVWLAAASVFFYAWWNIVYLPLILGSIAFNYAVGVSISRCAKRAAASRKGLLIFGVAVNLSLLAYFKYYNFFVSNLNHLASTRLSILNIILPLGISFFTFTQIAFLVDTYKSTAKEYSFLNYVLFVTFFPHLIAGPIIHHKEMMPQFDSLRNKLLNRRNIFAGLFLFSAGLFKKLVLADTFALWAGYGFNQVRDLTMIEAWLVTLSYAFQLYFDFSGYTDMALGSSLFFNIKLPCNFNSPYKSVNIQDFWRRWHMTLSRFFMNYLYIPLGGNRSGLSRTCFNLLATFIIGGIWHGAGWLFILWGALHGIANVVYRYWSRLNIRMHALVAWFITFNFVSFTWIFFRSKNLAVASNIISSMFNPSKAGIGAFLRGPGEGHASIGAMFGLSQASPPINMLTLVFIAAGFFIVTGSRNSNEIAVRVEPGYKWAVISGLLFGISMLFISRTSEFLYFQF